MLFNHVRIGVAWLVMLAVGFALPGYGQTGEDEDKPLDLPGTYRFVRMANFAPSTPLPTSLLNARPIDTYPYEAQHMPDTIRLPLRNEMGYATLMYPIKGRVNSRFGPRYGGFHYGTDFQLAIGDTVVAVMDGVVRISRVDEGGYGNFIVIAHKNGLETLYGHLDKPLVRVGDFVSIGQAIGLGGNTGRSTGPHLHFEFRFMGEQFNPEEVFDASNFSFRVDTITLTQGNFAHLHRYPHRYAPGTIIRTTPAQLASHTHAHAHTHTASIASGGQGGQSDTPAATVHIVRKGDTLYGIARRYGTTISRLCQLNGLTRQSVLQIGQRIQLI